MCITNDYFTDEHKKQTTHELMKRPTKPGTKGRTIALRANYYEVKLTPITVFHYDVAVSRKGAAKKSKGKPAASSDDNEDAEGKWNAVSRLPRYSSIFYVHHLAKVSRQVF